MVPDHLDVKDLNDIDRAIMGVLQVEGRSTFAQIAQHVGLSPAAVHERVKKLEARGVITGYRAVGRPGEGRRGRDARSSS